MAKKITRIVLTGGPAAGKTTLISRILKEFKQEDGWKVITIPETATDLISGFGIGPFPGCMSMLDFQYYVIEDQLHKERLALRAAEQVPEEKVLVVYDRALFDDKAYISDEEFRTVLAHFGKTEEEVLAGYDTVLHLVSCAKGAEFAYNYGNAARYETVERAREIDDNTIRAWSAHPSLQIIDNSVDFEDKINRAIAAIYRVLGQEVPDTDKSKYLIAMPPVELLPEKYGAVPTEMMQTYLTATNPLGHPAAADQRKGIHPLSDGERSDAACRAQDQVPLPLCRTGDGDRRLPLLGRAGDPLRLWQRPRERRSAGGDRGAARRFGRRGL